MTELEDALRRELRDRTDLAEQEARPVGLQVSIIEERARRGRRRRVLAAGSAALTVMALAGAVLAAQTLGGQVPTSRNRQLPLVDAGLTPPGWAPVPYLGGQVSVPAPWFVESAQSEVCGGGVRGMIFVGQTPTKRSFRDMGCRLAVNVVVLTRFQSQHPPSSVTAVRLNAVLNGIRVATGRGADGQELVIAPSLGIQVTARGPLARRVLATLTRSPLAVVLERGPALRTPGDWQWHTFGGITFAAPAKWAVERDNQWGGCGFGIAARTIRLTTASVISVWSCPGPPDDAGFEAARPGVIVGAGRYAAQELAHDRYRDCRRLQGLRACVIEQSPGGLLMLAAFPVGYPRPTLVEIGLAGSGAVARTILDSMGPARP